MVRLRLLFRPGKDAQSVSYDFCIGISLGLQVRFNLFDQYAQKPTVNRGLVLHGFSWK